MGAAEVRLYTRTILRQKSAHASKTAQMDSVRLILLGCLRFMGGFMLVRVLFYVLFFCFSFVSSAHEKLAIQKFEELRNLESRLAPDKKQTLFVFDIDNTILRSKQDLGGDAWFTWQESLLKSNPGHADLVAQDFTGLLSVQGMLFALGVMLPPEAETPTIVREIQDAGHSVVLLTSRGLEFENQTERELKRNGYDIKRSALPPKSGYASAFLPYDLHKPGCLTEAEMRDLALPEAREVLYRNGIIMTGGQHKGAMLRALLCKLNRSFANIVFVDDHQKHVDRVYAAYANQPGEVLSVKYNYMDAEVQAFHQSDKAQVRAQWAKLKSVLAEIF